MFILKHTAYNVLELIIQDIKHNNNRDLLGFTLFVNEFQAYRSSFFYFKVIYLKVFNFIKYGHFTWFYEHPFCINYTV